MNFNFNLTPTLSLFELVIAITTFFGLVLALALAIDYMLDFLVLTRNGSLRLTSLIGLRTSITIALVHLLFVFYAVAAALTPPPLRSQNQALANFAVGLFELVVLIMALNSALNLRDRLRIRRNGLAAKRPPRYGERR